MKTIMRLLAFAVLQIVAFSTAAPSCEILPTPGLDIEIFGAIFIPESTLSIEDYRDTAIAIQNEFPGSMWIGLPSNFSAGSDVTPTEVATASQACIEEASAQGIENSTVYLAVHGSSGLSAQYYITSGQTSINGLLLLGSYTSADIEISFPTLVAIGTIDGLALAHLRPEVERSSDLLTVLAVDGVNNAQIAAGNLPTELSPLDIDAELDIGSAHLKIAQVVSSFLVLGNQDAFDQNTIIDQQAKMQGFKNLTDEFVRPFTEMFLLENTNLVYCPWTVYAETVVLNLNEAEAVISNTALYTSNEILDFDNFLHSKPAVTPNGCTANVTTFSYPFYLNDSRPYTESTTVSSTVLKSKLKLEEVVLDALCFPARPATGCNNANDEALALALSKASPEALSRYQAKGKQLVTVPDNNVLTGPGWSNAEDLTYTDFGNGTVSVQSIALVTAVDLPTDNLEAMRYCDLLSPYRALEWIYVTSLQKISLS